MIRFEKSVERLPKANVYRWSLVYVQRPVPVTASFEDDMIAISSKYGSCFRGGSQAFERSRLMHRFTLYRWYRAIKRMILVSEPEPAAFGKMESPPDWSEEKPPIRILYRGGSGPERELTESEAQKMFGVS